MCAASTENLTHAGIVVFPGAKTLEVQLLMGGWLEILRVTTQQNT